MYCMYEYISYYYYNLQKWAHKSCIFPSRVNGGEIIIFEAKSRMKRNLM